MCNRRSMTTGVFLAVTARYEHDLRRIPIHAVG
jgi:hypothetical protein